MSKQIPHFTKLTIDSYVKDRIPPGGFLYAVLTNDLTGSFNRADLENRHALFDIVCYCFNDIPAESWGTKEKVDKWLGREKKP